MRELREAVWDQVPGDAVPERFEERLALLLAAVRSLEATRGAASDRGRGAGGPVATAGGPGSSGTSPGNAGGPLRVLDAGCGDGAFAAALLGAGCAVVAADAAQGALDRTAQIAPGAQRLLWGDGEPLALPTASVDLVWAGETLEHVGDGEAWLAELWRVLVPGGRLLLTTPDHPLPRRLRLALSRHAFDDHFSPWRDHLRFFTAASLAEILDRADFTTIEVRSAYGRRWAPETLIASARR